MEFSPRPATFDDLDQITEIERVSISPPWSRAAFAAELEKKSSCFWVLTDDETDEKVLAYAVLSFPAEQAHLLTFAVNPQFRKRGLGTYFLRLLLAYFHRENADSVILEVRKGNEAAIRLYQSLGFVVIHSMPRFYPDGEDGFTMLYKTDRNKLTGDPDVDFDTDPEETDPRGKSNLN